MPVRIFRIVICIIALISAIFFLRNNILSFDDFHPAYEEVLLPDFSYQYDIDDETEKNIPDVYSLRKGYHIHINLDIVKMYVFKDGELLKTYPVSGGKASTPTPLGTYKIISKDTWGEGFGGAWLGFYVPWGKYGIHGTKYPWVIGKSNSSKGCIRMNNKDVKELYKLVPHGTTVTIVHNNRKFRNLKNGDVGSDVRDVQINLKKLDYYRGPIDGKFGAGLKRSVTSFQKDNKLWASGIIDRQTYNSILDKVKQYEMELE